MEETNKEFRLNLAEEMQDRLKERNWQLESVEKSPFSEWLKAQMRKEIMDNFENQMNEIKSRPGYKEAKKTHLDEIRTKQWVRKAEANKEKLLKEYEKKLAKADENIAQSKKHYEDAQIAHKWMVENVPIELKIFREIWQEKVESILDSSKEKIIKAAKKIPVKMEIDSDGSRLVEFKLWKKTYKILNPRLRAHSDDKYYYNPRYNSITMCDDNVCAGWMRWDDVDKWDNQKLKEYVKEKQSQWLHIPKIEEMKQLLDELWEKAWLHWEPDKIAMFWYLTGLDWWYWLSMWDNEKSGGMWGLKKPANSDDERYHDAPRSTLSCHTYHKGYEPNCHFGSGRHDKHTASLLMIACD